jgi:hypothetical protein
MFQLSDLPELVSDYASGDVDWMIAYSVLLRLLGDHEVSAVMSALSPELAARFDNALHEDFQDEERAKTGLWIDNAGGEPPNRDQIVRRIMRWVGQRCVGK